MCRFDLCVVRCLECYSCPQQEVCLGRFPQWPGRCRAGEGGKCFVRSDPNGRKCHDTIIIIHLGQNNVEVTFCLAIRAGLYGTIPTAAASTS